MFKHSWLVAVFLVACTAAKSSAPTVVATAGKGEAPRLRLPDGASPVRYALELTIDPSREPFSGRVDIDLKIEKPTKTLWINASELTPVAAWIESAGARVAASARVAGEDFWVIELARTVGGDARLHLEYDGVMSAKNSQGLFRQQSAGDWYAFTQFEAIDARKAFPCFDEPAYKAAFQLTLRVPSGLVAVANTPAIGTETVAAPPQKEPQPSAKLPENPEAAPVSLHASTEASARTSEWQRVRFAESRPLPSYLVAFAVGPFTVVDAGKGGRNGTPVRVIAPRGRGSETRYAAETTPALLERLEEYFGIPYPFEKLDVIAVPYFSGAMENPGLITYAQTSILASAREETVRFKRGYAGLAAHELAHQWFGDLVTMKWWDDLWLNEAFASWMGQKIVDAWRPDWQLAAGNIAYRSHSMEADSLVSARKIRQPIVTKDDIHNAFDGITYGKGSAVLAMFERQIGPESFRRGVQRYLKAHAYGNADAGDFLAALSAEAKEDIAPAFSTFLDQTGAPLVSGKLTCSGNKSTLALTMERYRPVGSTGGPQQQKWTVPVCVRFGDVAGDSRTCAMVGAGAATEISLPAAHCPEWVLLNEGMAGYYRSAYVGDGLQRLVKNGLAKLTVNERVGLVGDVAALVSADKLPAAQAMAFVAPLATDANRSVVQQTVDLVTLVGERIAGPEVRAKYAALIRKLYGEKARALGWQAVDSRLTDDEDARLLRSALVPLVAGDGGDEVLAARAAELAQKWLLDHAAIEPDMVGPILGIAARRGDTVLFDRVLAAAQKERSARDRRALLSALGHFQNPALIERALGVVVARKFDGREVTAIMWSAGSQPETREQAYRFVKARFEELVQVLPQHAGAHLPRVAGDLCDPQQRNDVATFFTGRSTRYEGGPRTLEQTLEEIDLCSALRRAQQASALGYLKTTDK